MISFRNLNNLFQQGPLQLSDKAFVISAILILVFLSLYPIWGDVYSLSVMRDALILSIFALSLDFMWGQTGLLSFGHSTFFGAGAYTMALLTLVCGAGSLTALVSAMVVSACIALLVGYFLIYAGVRREYFAIVTLALALIGHQIVLSFAKFTGGDAGLIDLPLLSFGLSGTQFTFSDDMPLYFLAVGLGMIVLFSLWVAVRSNYGKILKAILNNEQRAQALGHNTSLHLLVAFSISAALAGLSGAIFTTTQGIVTPELIGPMLSTEVIVWVAVGGRGTLLGPMLGCFLVVRMRQEISSISTTLWPLLLGVFFVLVVFVAPGGIMTIARWIGNSRLIAGRNMGEERK
jgi:branched-chain amino acid transport system permease protein